MKEQLYTIPVNDAFGKDCECPVCEMYETLQKNAIDFTMGPSYMEDDVRMVTDRTGFCSNHVKLLYEIQNRLGLALMLKTHMDRSIQEIEKLLQQKQATGGGFFKKKEGLHPVVDFTRSLEHSCFVCNKIRGMFELYLASFFYLYRKEDEFKKKFRASKGFCTKHFGMLYDLAEKHLNGVLLEEFRSELGTLYTENMKRVRDDLEWFTDKFDYRYVNEPWKNSKDALPRTIRKTNSVPVDDK